MLKEFILAITLGAILGFGATGTFYAISKSRKTEIPQINPVPTISISPTPTSADSLDTTSPTKITIINPINNFLTSNSKVTINGTTSSQSRVIVTTVSSIFTTIADNSGDFSVDVDLNSGANIINLTAIDDNDNQVDTQLIITYSTAKI